MKILLITLLIILLIILIVILIYYIHHNSKSLLKQPKIAVYSYNFGNFRNELRNGIDYATVFPNFDYFFYTDQNIKSKKWNIIKVPLQNRN